jgi:tetratricopeptide (TPR) repeat protein
LADNNLIILYFFDVELRSSQEDLLNLDQLQKQYKGADITVWGITLSGRVKSKKFLNLSKPGFPVLLDTGKVSDSYEARLSLPSVCIIGPNLTILDYFQGSGQTSPIMLIRLAERQLQRRQSVLAKAISELVEKKEPGNLKALTVKGYANLQEGNVNSAEKIFQDLSQQKGLAELLGKEGLATLYSKSGNMDMALDLIQELVQKAPERVYPHVLKGKILYTQNRKKEAQAEFEQAIHSNEAELFQKAIAFNQYGRFYATQGSYEKSRELYNKAIEINPYFAEAASNIGLSYEKEGQWEKALETYRHALSLNENDTFAAILAKKAEDMVTLQKDVEKKKRIDLLVKDLADRYKSNKKSGVKADDTWTSRPLIITFIDFQEKGGLAERDGFSTVLISEMNSELNASGRIQVVERILLESLLAELNLGSSDLADPETALRLGKILAAKIIGTGSLYFLPEGALLSLRLIDTETSAISKVITRQLSNKVPFRQELNALTREILNAIILQYPLQGYVVQSNNHEVLINLGSEHGVILGSRFEVIEEQKPIEYKGKKLQPNPEVIGLIEITRVETDLSYGRIMQKTKPIRMDCMIKEIIKQEVIL